MGSGRSIAFVLEESGFFRADPAVLSDLGARAFVGSRLTSFTQKSGINTFRLASYRPDTGGTDDIGTVMFGGVSLINHSCFPNASWVFNGNVNIVRTLRSVKVGEDLRISYDSSYTYVDTPTKQRRERFQRHYFFECDCPACTNGWGPSTPYHQFPAPEKAQFRETCIKLAEKVQNTWTQDEALENLLIAQISEMDKMGACDDPSRKPCIEFEKCMWALHALNWIRKDWTKFVLETCGFFTGEPADLETTSRFASLLVDFGYKACVNAFGLACYDPGSGLTIDIGIGIYGTASLVNHSCIPNCTYNIHGNFIIIRTLVPVVAGQELTITYDDSYTYITAPLEKRQHFLQGNYFFECKCLACENDWGPDTEASEFPVKGESRLRKKSIEIASKAENLAAYDPEVEAELLKQIAILDKFRNLSLPNSRPFVEFENAVWAAHVLEVSGFFGPQPSVLRDRDQLSFVCSRLTDFAQKAWVNSFGLARYRPDTGHTENIGTAVYASVSLINHSCIPNCSWVFNGSINIVRVLKSIKAGDDLGVSYHSSYTYPNVGVAERRQRFLDHYFFECQCEACVNGWGPDTPHQKFPLKEKSAFRQACLKTADMVFAAYEYNEAIENMLLLQIAQMDKILPLGEPNKKPFLECENCVRAAHTCNWMKHDWSTFVNPTYDV
ncbi:unnamed protein product [Cyprideis torosa]|uniref:Uncharacterized protein n=1 Tax=Cyprideis torosa TaxID=163714 RepID=A0A7R8WGF8_9CRUS|nr:unnamed protein product [Cyprideis torosa]CAG0898113.1 unnamed protein product [Cyprideis torosa]